jgi:hypothetical protein
VYVVSLFLHMADLPTSLAELVAESRRGLVDHIAKDDRSAKRLRAKHTLAAMQATRDARSAKDRTSHFSKYAALFPPAASAEANDTTAAASAKVGPAASTKAGDTKAAASAEAGDPKAAASAEAGDTKAAASNEHGHLI